MQLTSNQLNIINQKLLLGSLNFVEIGEEAQVSRGTVRKYAKKFGLHKGNTTRLKTHSLNTEYFKIFDIPEKAYILGLLYADGCNTRKGLQLGLQEQDKDVVEFVRSQLNVSNALRFIPKAKPSWKNKWELEFKSIEFSNELTRVGCVPAKSLTLKFPDFLPESLIPHFIRGYFDGDGSLLKHDAWRMSFTSSSVEFIESLAKYLSEKIQQPLNIYKGKGYSISTSKCSTIQAIINLMYVDSTFCMQRKYENACAFMVEKGR